MKILNLRVKNFGQHENVQFKADSSVVGLVGENGAGKSNMLAALEFALTGETALPLDTYVRHGAGNALVEMEFSKNGQVGKITRQFGSTPKRMLVWDGRTIKAAKEVDALMASIFGADKKAIASAVFIGQGMMEKILFVTEAERRGQFIKLVNMSFCAGRAKIVDGQVKRLESTIQDLQPAIQAMANQRETLAIQIQSIRGELEKMPDYAEDVAFCTERLKNEENLATILANIGEHQNALALAQVTAGQINARLQVPNLQSVIHTANNLERSYNEKLGVYNEACAVYTELTHYDRVVREITALETRQQELVKQGQDLNPDALSLEQISKLLVQRRQQAQYFAGIDALNKSKSEWQTYYNTTKAAQDALKAPVTPVPNIQHTRERLVAQDVAIQALTTAHATYTRLAKCMTAPDGQVTRCPDCGLKLADPSELSPANLERIASDLTTSKNHRQEIADYLEHIELEWKLYNDAKTAKRQAVDQAEKMLAKIESDLKPLMIQVVGLDSQQTTADVERYLNMSTSLPSIMKQLHGLGLDKESKVAEKDGYVNALNHLATRMNYTPDILKTQYDTLTELSLKLSTWKTAVTVEVNPLQERFTKLNAQLEQDTKRKAELETALETPMPANVMELQVVHAGNMQATRGELEARQAIRVSTQGRLEQANLTYAQSNAEYQTLVRRASADEEKRKLIADLKTLKDLLSEDGLPLTVVRHHFQYLAALTQEALVKLNANFCIMVDPVEPLAFKFMRLDDAEQYEMPMEKLSGGQRVRLCLAFLMAVQQRLVKEVGLLVLDEPSNHVDAEGKEALAELLTSMQSQLTSTDMQIWCADHDPILATCFGKTLTLKKQ